MGHLVIAMLFLGCTPPETVEEACPARVRGDERGDAAAAAAVLRASCYRKLIGFDAFEINGSLQSATSAHTQWMDTNDAFTDVETPGTPDFVGETFTDRAQAAGWVASAYFWTLYDRDVGDDPVAVIDRWIADPYRREALLQPDARYVGFGLSGGFASWATAFDFPTRTAGYAVYPRDGQRDVPTTWDSEGYTGDDVPDGEVGFPITITVGAPEGNTDATGVFLPNPYELVIDDVVLAGPNGPVANVVVTPDNPPQNGSLLATAAVIPLDPLERGETWILQAKITWLGGEADVSSTFVTAE